MTRDEAVALIRNADLGDRTDEILAGLRPSVVLDATRIPLDQLAIGDSRIGGAPDLPEHFSWPRWTPTRLESAAFGKIRRSTLPERSLDFIAQLNLKDLQGFSATKDLPPEGMLYFFFDAENQPWGFDPEDHLGARVIYSNVAPGSLTRGQHPDSDAKWESFPCKLAFSQDWTIPNPNLLPDGYEESLEILEAIDELKQDLIGNSDNQHYKPIHRLFGWPEPVQGDMQLECQLLANGIDCGGGAEHPLTASLAPGAKDWQLLLQIDTDEDNPGWMWGDCGRIYYWIHKDDLEARRFEKTRLILQCS